MSLNDKRVAVTFTGLRGYPADFPFNLPERYPEYLRNAVDLGSKVYGAVREILYRLELDRVH